jgi:hypothetical protein
MLAPAGQAIGLMGHESTREDSTDEGNEEAQDWATTTTTTTTTVLRLAISVAR